MALADVGPLVALAAIAIGIIALVAGLTGGAVFLWPLLLAAIGIGVLWRQADEAQRDRWRDSTGRIDPIRAVIGLGGWASYARIVAGVAFLVAAIVLFAVRGGNIGVARDAVIAGAARRARGRPDDRAVAVPAVLGPDRGAGRADPLAGAGRRGRAPARLGAADARADPEDRRRPGSRGPAGAGAGARPALLALHLRRHRRQHVRGRAAHGRGRGGGPFGVPVEVVVRGRPRPARGACGRWCSPTREAMVNAAKHSGAQQVDVYAEVTERGTEVFVRDRGAGFVVDDGRRRPARRARQHHGPDGAARRRGRPSAARPARAPRCGCTCRTTKGPADDAAADRGDRRRPRDVPIRGPGRARRRRRRAGRGGGRRHGRRRGASRTGPTWCCSTCTCPAAAGPR